MSTDAQQIRFFRKSYIDLDDANVSLTSTDTEATNNGNEFVDFVRNRNNFSIWGTTGSSDSATTVFTANMVEERNVNSIILVEHNFKDFSIEYWTGLVWADMPTPINILSNTESTNYYIFDTLLTSQIRITIDSTQVADADKFMHQLVISENVGDGQFIGWPELKPTIGTNKISRKMMSGKENIVDSIETFKCSLSVKHWRKQPDIEIVEALYLNRQSFLVSISGGSADQFFSTPRGYRKQDIYLMRNKNDYSPEYVRGIYINGLKLSLRLVEVTN